MTTTTVHCETKPQGQKTGQKTFVPTALAGQAQTGSKGDQRDKATFTFVPTFVPLQPLGNTGSLDDPYSQRERGTMEGQRAFVPQHYTEGQRDTRL